MDSDFKAGFTRLLKSFEDDSNDVVKITRAFGLATKAHKGQLNRDEPYINHPLRVALILAEELKMRDTDLACAALLHDAQMPEEDLKDFGERVYSVVHAPAEPKADGKAAEEYFASIAKAPKDVRYIKLAERLDNVRGMKGQGFKDKVTRYKEETQKYAMPVADKTDDRLSFKLSVALYELK
jgi:(p)ppGpp synthase/HD superfamily hydrolase